MPFHFIEAKCILCLKGVMISLTSKATLGRLPSYLKYLRSLPASHVEISATAIAKALGLGEVQVRKDLASVCGSGKPKIGYSVSELTACMERVLSDKAPREAVIVGAGKLGRALLGFDGFAEYGITVSKGFDTDNTKWGPDILPISELKSYCVLHQVELGILTVPPDAADEAAKHMIDAGIRAIWCFSVSHLNMPDNITVQYENLALSLAHLLNKSTSHTIGAQSERPKQVSI